MTKDGGVYTRMGNRPVELPTGLIALHAYPAGQDPIGQGGAFKARCYSLGTDPNAVFFLTLPVELEPFFYSGSINDIRIPFVVRERTHKRLPYYRATLLVPPGTTKRSRFFDSHMVVPDLVADDLILGNERSSRGYVMTSEHCPRQEFFAAAKEMPPVPDPSSLPKGMFQARISDPHKNGKGLPFVRPILDYNVNPHVVRPNAEAIEDLRGTPALDFWWDWVHHAAGYA